VTPRGFVLLPGTVRQTATAVVFDVARETCADVALVCKRLGPRARGEAWMRERLAAEGKLLKELDGVTTPRWVADGEDEQGPWLVMEHAPGQPLATHMGARGAWLDTAARACLRALAVLHDAGVVHGDPSPDNVFVTDDAGRATLVDLGLSRWRDAPPMPSGPFRGTLLYAAPEVARGDLPGPRADVFSMAAALLHVACGEPPRTQDEAAPMLAAAGDSSIEPWATRAARGLSPRVAEALVRCCHFDPAERPSDAGEALRAS
jgi:eukaryotic-like serine/threonine-protein kinase